MALRGRESTRSLPLPVLTSVLQQHDAEKKSFLPSHFSRFTLDHLKLAAIEPRAAALRAAVDDHYISDATLDHVQTIYRTLAQPFVRRSKLRPTIRAKVVPCRRFDHLCRRAFPATAKTSLTVCHSSGLLVERL